MKTVLDILIGKTVKEVWVEEDESGIAFVTDEGTFTFVCYGDCCSETWIADIVGLGNLLGKKVTKLEHLELPSDPPDARGRQDHDDVYGERISTDSYYQTDLIYRNSSNGYYGGSLEPTSDSLKNPRKIEPNGLGHWTS